MPVVFKERTAGREPSARFAIDVGETQVSYVLYDDRSDRAPGHSHDVDEFILYDWINKIIGTTRTGVAPSGVGAPGGAGSIQRVMPMSHPVYKSLFADDVTVRVPTGESYANGFLSFSGLAVESLAERYAAYNAFELDVRFSSRPYPVVPNERMTVETINFVGPFGGNYQLYAYPEWKRFLFYTTKAQDTQISATQASAMVYRAPGAPAGVNDTPFNSIPSMMVPDSLINMIWYGVPRRYLDSPKSYLLKYRGYINYRDFWKWPKASLLYLGCDTIRTYVPPRFELAAQSDPVLAGTFAAEAVVDLSLSFIHTTRTTDFPPDPADLVHASWLAAGHNLLGHVLTRRFYYASGNLPGTPEHRAPSYFAVPFELLWQDPDASSLLALP